MRSKVDSTWIAHMASSVAVTATAFETVAAPGTGDAGWAASTVVDQGCVQASVSAARSIQAGLEAVAAAGHAAAAEYEATDATAGSLVKGAV